MPDFSELFIKSKGYPIRYKGNTLILLDKFPIKDGEIIVASIEKTNSDCKQGLSIDITGYCEINNKIYKQGQGVNMLFWEDTAPPEIYIKIHTKIDYILIKNIWETSSPTGIKMDDSGTNGAAMIVEEIENGRRYRCNDWHPDENFDDIVFTVRKINS